MPHLGELSTPSCSDSTLLICSAVYTEPPGGNKILVEVHFYALLGAGVGGREEGIVLGSAYEQVVGDSEVYKKYRPLEEGTGTIGVWRVEDVVGLAMLVSREFGGAELDFATGKPRILARAQ